MLQDKLEMFELWVDDYLTKPFEIEELVARLKSLLKRWEQKIDDEKISWNLKINYSKNKIYFKNNEVNFPHKQYLILEFLMNNIWYPQNKVKIMEYVWWEAEENLDLNSTTLESHIYAIRKKLWKQFIKTVKGVWYIIEK
jgi:DNA-binding response OmpR family regulator